MANDDYCVSRYMYTNLIIIILYLLIANMDTQPKTSSDCYRYQNHVHGFVVQTLSSFIILYC